MPFQSGRVTFTRFKVQGDAPQSVNDTALGILREFAFKETEIGAPDEVEAGFITGEHIFDTQFSYEKNGFGEGSSLMLFAMRVDTNKVPSEIKKAYRKINEQAAAEGNPSGFASKNQKREAKELAERQVHEDLAKGRFRRSKSVQLLWDLRAQTLYVGATGNTVYEQVARLMHEAFSLQIELITAGRLAGDLLRNEGRQRDYEDVKPSQFTPPPADGLVDQDDADGPRDHGLPILPWIAKSVDIKDFLGNELLMWLWWHTETRDGEVNIRNSTGGETAVFLAIDKSLEMECAWAIGGKTTLRADGPTRLPEAGDAIRTGKWPRKMGLILSDGEHQWELGWQGDRMVVSSAALPEVPEAQSPRELVEARLDLVQHLVATLDGVYEAFIDQRLSSGWASTREKIRKWIESRTKPKVAEPMPVG